MFKTVERIEHVVNRERDKSGHLWPQHRWVAYHFQGDNIIDYQPIEKYGELRLLKTIGGIPTGEYIVRPRLLMLEKAGVRERCKKWILKDYGMTPEQYKACPDIFLLYPQSGVNANIVDENFINDKPLNVVNIVGLNAIEAAKEMEECHDIWVKVVDYDFADNEIGLLKTSHLMHKKFFEEYNLREWVK